MDLDAGDLAKFAKYSDLLNRAGIVGDVLGTAIAIGQATAEYNAGHYEEAGTILAGYTGNLVGGYVGGTALSGLAMGALLLVPGVNVGVLGGMAIAGAAGLAGGYLGAEGGEALFKGLYKDIANLGIVPFSQHLLDDYGWALNNPSAVLAELGGDGLCALPDWVTNPFGLFDAGGRASGPRPGCPLVLDLNGDGFHLTAKDGPDAVYWDIDRDGFREASGWVTGGDGLLAIDRNGNGTIDDNSELFGNDATHATGFETLAAYDSNHDNKITSADAQFANLRVWIDANGDGVSQASELHTLSELRITSISLLYGGGWQDGGNGNSI